MIGGEGKERAKKCVGKGSADAVRIHPENAIRKIIFPFNICPKPYRKKNDFLLPSFLFQARYCSKEIQTAS
jgi:hypothetical protein